MRLPGLRFRLSTLLVCFLGAGCILGWIERKRSVANRQRESIEAIENLGGQVLYDYNVKDGQAVPPVPPWLISLLGKDFFCDAVDVRWSHQPTLKNEDLAHLKNLPHLKTLFLCGGKLTAEGLVHLKGLSRLEDLSLGIQMTDDDLEFLKTIRSLKELYLMGPRPDNFVVRMQDEANSVYDAEVYDSRVTKGGIDELATSLSGCRISY